MRISDWSSDVCSSDLMAGASVCVQTGSMPEVTFADVNRRYTLQMRPVIFDSVQATRQAFFSGRCDALITDASALASVRAPQAGNPDDYVIFPANDEVTPLTHAVRHGYRSEERRVGKECVRTGRFRWSPAN